MPSVFFYFAWRPVAEDAVLPKCRILSEYFGFIAFSSDSRTDDAISRIFSLMQATIPPYQLLIKLTHAHRLVGVAINHVTALLEARAHFWPETGDFLRLW